MNNAPALKAMRYHPQVLFFPLHHFPALLRTRQCFVLSLGHLSCFLSSARSRSAHRAVSSLRGELRGGVLAAELAAREAVEAAAAAQRVARLASREALEATARAASAAASARNEGSFLLEEVFSAPKGPRVMVSMYNESVLQAAYTGSKTDRLGFVQEIRQARKIAPDGWVAYLLTLRNSKELIFLDISVLHRGHPCETRRLRIPPPTPHGFPFPRVEPNRIGLNFGQRFLSRCTSNLRRRCEPRGTGLSRTNKKELGWKERRASSWKHRQERRPRASSSSSSSSCPPPNPSSRLCFFFLLHATCFLHRVSSHYHGCTWYVLHTRMFHANPTNPVRVAHGCIRAEGPRPAWLMNATTQTTPRLVRRLCSTAYAFPSLHNERADDAAFCICFIEHWPAKFPPSIIHLNQGALLGSYVPTANRSKRINLISRGFGCLLPIPPLICQLGHLKSLLDTKAGQEDVTSITKAMGDVEETLAVVRQSIPGQSALLELQVTLPVRHA